MNMKGRIGAAATWLRSVLDLDVLLPLLVSISIIVLYGAALLGTAVWVFRLASH